MGFGYTEEEFERVKPYLISALEKVPGIIDESQLFENIKAGHWHLLTAEKSAAVLEFIEIEGELIANVLVIGGEKNKSLKEIMKCYSTLAIVLREQGFSKIVGQPRKEWNKYLIKNGFCQKGNEFIKEL